MVSGLGGIFVLLSFVVTWGCTIATIVTLIRIFRTTGFFGYGLLATLLGAGLAFQMFFKLLPPSLSIVFFTHLWGMATALLTLAAWRMIYLNIKTDRGSA